MKPNPYGPIRHNDRRQHKSALELEAPERERVRSRLQDYLSRTGMESTDFAHRISYSKTSLAFFMRDEYHRISGSSTAIRAAIEGFIDSHPIDAPTELVGVVYDTANVRAIRDTFQQLLRRPTAYMIYGPPGSQKSFVLEHEIARLNREELRKKGIGRRAYYVYAQEQMSPPQMMKEIAIACGAPCAGDKSRIARNLAFEFVGRRVLLVIDEAQHLDLHCLEALRLLLDRPPYFSLLLAGSHDLKISFDRLSARLEQWNSRIIRKVCLPGVTREEAEGIIRREAGSLLSGVDARVAEKKIAGLIASSTSKDAFENGRPYINVRTLTNALCAVR